MMTSGANAAFTLNWLRPLLGTGAGTGAGDSLRSTQPQSSPHGQSNPRFGSDVLVQQSRRGAFAGQQTDLPVACRQHDHAGAGWDTEAATRCVAQLQPQSAAQAAGTDIETDVSQTSSFEIIPRKRTMTGNS
jgi:hypothetical protein